MCINCANTSCLGSSMPPRSYASQGGNRYSEFKSRREFAVYASLINNLPKARSHDVGTLVSESLISS